MTSHCVTDSNREDLAKTLNKTIQIDFRGACAGSWDKRLKNVSTDGKRHGTAFAVEEYYFYLAFENTLCKDYVTEKFFDALSQNIVPVVFGGANYSDFAPPHSFIDIQDFQTVEEVGEYLNHLIQHPAEYLEYFWWKQYYEVRDLSDAKEDRISPNFPCALCSYLHKTEKEKVYHDLREWWEGGAGCQGPIRWQNCDRKTDDPYKERGNYGEKLNRNNVTKILELQEIL